MIRQNGLMYALALKQHYSMRYIAEQLTEMLTEGEMEDQYEELFIFRYWWGCGAIRPAGGQSALETVCRGR